MSSAFMSRRDVDKMRMRCADVLAAVARRGEPAKLVKNEPECELARLRKRVAELEKEPDAGQAPFRGSSVGTQSPDAERPSHLKVAQARDEAEQIAYLKRMARHQDPELRQRAEARLQEFERATREGASV